MNPLLSRIGVLLAPEASLWGGTVSSYDDATFILTVATVSGSLADLSAGLAVVRLAEDQWARIRSVNPGGGTITLAENPINFQATDVVGSFNARLPFPRYQRVTPGGTVYKDWDIAFPGQYASMPPLAHCSPGVIVADTGESVSLDASASEAMAVGATISTYTWTPGAGGVITGSGATVSVEYSTGGFRYLSLMLTDSQATTHTLYIPVWIAQTPLSDVNAARLTWRAGGGLVADLGLLVPPGFINRSPVCVLDLDSNEVLFYGFIHPQNWRYDFEINQLTFTALSPTAYLNELYSYPFLLETVGVGVASDWHQVYNLTLQRALWFLLHWHSTIPQIAGVGVPSAARSIAGQKFAAGNLQSQLRAVSSAAFWQTVGEREGALLMRDDPLYVSGFAGLPTLTLTDDEVLGELRYTDNPASISEARLSGVYYSGGWEPLIVRAPTHPEDLGRPAEVANLAPLSAAELRTWAGRHLALAGAREYSGALLVDLDPSVTERLVLPDSVALGLTSVTYGHDAGGLSWGIQFNGKTRGDDADSVDEPQPPAIVVPEPETPPAIPPIPILPDVAIWPLRVYIATKTSGVYLCEDFDGPDGAMPTWTPVIGGATVPTDIDGAGISPTSETLFIIKDSSDAVWRKTLAGDWEEVLTEADVQSILGEGASDIKWVECGADGAVYIYTEGDTSTWLLKSTSDGANGSYAAHGRIGGWATELGNLILEGTIGYASQWRLTGPNKATVLEGTLGTGAWADEDVPSLSFYVPPVYRDPTQDNTWSTESAGKLYFYTGAGGFSAPVASADGICGRMTFGYPKLWIWDTGLLVSVGQTGNVTYENHLLSSTDDFATLSDSGAVGRVISIFRGLPLSPPFGILGNHTDATVLNPHVLFVSDDLGATVPVERAGPTAANPSTTDSIPYDCGGITNGGILIPTIQV